LVRPIRRLINLSVVQGKMFDPEFAGQKVMEEGRNDRFDCTNSRLLHHQQFTAPGT
jgi:hypothetical protein